ncbi:response regulator transcription factor [Labrys sp. ZIDIC5]|uniref:LuxR C-terminal-related transcriptional regulator n=1 Tax=Labrys sedimenti TaxID=3106036 RepID=UPI002ACA7ECF|nr:response regulator transcription factor [Labrys sp. ZIDIC5]MDZ5453589.1 response regulator transcription factor [Labrys sp. ZIDIC5]
MKAQPTRRLVEEVTPELSRGQIMSHHVTCNDMLDCHDHRQAEPGTLPVVDRKVVLLIESRPLLGEIFSHALKEAADDIDVRIMGAPGEGGTQASLAILSLVQRSTDPLFIAFVIQQLQTRIGKLPLLVVTDNSDPAIGRLMDEAGVHSWITASMGFNAMVSAIRQGLSLPAREETAAQPISYASAPPLFKEPPSSAPKPPPERHLRSDIHLSLTDREMDVLSLLQKGKQNKIIAHALNISESTAKVHIRNIMRKFHLRNRTEVALMCGSQMRAPGTTMMIGPDCEDSQMAVPAIAY